MKGLLSVSFGTSHADTREKCIDAINAALRDSMPEREFLAAWTSPRIIAKCAERCEFHDSLDEVFARAKEAGIDDLVVATSCLFEGGEYAKIERFARAYASQGAAVRLARPLLGCDVDIKALADILAREFADELGSGYLLLMGHGTKGSDNAAYVALQEELSAAGHGRALIACVDGALGFDEVSERIPAKEKVTLAPLMIVAGEHARHDLTGDEDSWEARLVARGHETSALICGLGERRGVQELICAHAHEAAFLTPAEDDDEARARG